MYHRLWLCIFHLLLVFSLSCQNQHTSEDKAGKEQVLVFSKTEGFRHVSIPDGQALIREIAEEENFSVKFSENSHLFTPENLSQYKVVIFLNTTLNILDESQEAAFQSYIQGGGGFVGIHAATDTEYEWPWYGQLVGAYFKNHPEIQEARIITNDPKHLACRELPEAWVLTEEWYNFRDVQPEVQVLLSLDEGSYEGGTMGEIHPLAWCREFEGGRMFYTALGHLPGTYQNPLFIKHLRGGILYAFGRD